MPVTDAYATAATYRAIANKSDTSEDAEILTDLTAVSRYLENRLGRFFTRDASDVARDYRPRVGARQLEIDDLSAAPTSVVVDENGDGTAEATWTVTTDFVLYPYNALVGSEVQPYTFLVIPAYSGKFFEAGRLVRVTGRWGWTAVPSAIERATCQLTAMLRLETSRASATVTDIGSVVRTSPEAQSIIRDLAEAYDRGRRHGDF